MKLPRICFIVLKKNGLDYLYNMLYYVYSLVKMRSIFVYILLQSQSCSYVALLY